MSRLNIIPNSGIELQFSTDCLGLWWDNSDSFVTIPEYRKAGRPGFGALLALRWGRWLCPVPKFWKSPIPNPWQSGDHWFTINVPIVLCPYLSIGIWRIGGYLGAKWVSLDDTGYEQWIPNLTWLSKQDDPNPNRALCITASFRKNRI